MGAPKKKKPVAKAKAKAKPVAKAKAKPASQNQTPTATRPPAAAPSSAPPPVDHQGRVAELWRRLEAYAVSIGAPSLGLAAGASERAIAQSEKTMGLRFPAEVRGSILEHDGQAGDRVFPWMPGCPPLYPLARIVEKWSEMQKLAAKGLSKPSADKTPPTGKLKPGVARACRIPLADGTFLDLDPGLAGVAGQLVTSLSKTDLVVIDTGFFPALERWVSVLERGIWVYDVEQHLVYPKAAPLFRGIPAGLFSKR